MSPEFVLHTRGTDTDYRWVVAPTDSAITQLLTENLVDGLKSGISASAEIPTLYIFRDGNVWVCAYRRVSASRLDRHGRRIRERAAIWWQSNDTMILSHDLPSIFTMLVSHLNRYLESVFLDLDKLGVVMPGIKMGTPTPTTMLLDREQSNTLRELNSLVSAWGPQRNINAGMPFICLGSTDVPSRLRGARWSKLGKPADWPSVAVTQSPIHFTTSASSVFDQSTVGKHELIHAIVNAIDYITLNADSIPTFLAKYWRDAFVDLLVFRMRRLSARRVRDIEIQFDALNRMTVELGHLDHARFLESSCHDIMIKILDLQEKP